MTLANVHCVRVKPKTKTVKTTTMCTYHIMYMNTHVDTIKGKFSCGIELAIQMLKQYDKDRYLLIALAKEPDSLYDWKNK